MALGVMTRSAAMMSGSTSATLAVTALAMTLVALGVMTCTAAMMTGAASATLAMTLVALGVMTGSAATMSGLATITLAVALLAMMTGAMLSTSAVLTMTAVMTGAVESTLAIALMPSAAMTAGRSKMAPPALARMSMMATMRCKTSMMTAKTLPTAKAMMPVGRSPVAFMAGSTLMAMLGVMAVLGYSLAAIFSAAMRWPLRSGAMMSMSGPSAVAMLLLAVGSAIFTVSILASAVFVAMMLGGLTIRTMMTISRRLGRRTMMMRMTKRSAWTAAMTTGRRRRIAGRSRVMMVPFSRRTLRLRDLESEAWPGRERLLLIVVQQG
jgi:hypothetical protein